MGGGEIVNESRKKTKRHKTSSKKQPKSCDKRDGVIQTIVATEAELELATVTERANAEEPECGGKKRSKKKRRREHVEKDLKGGNSNENDLNGNVDGNENEDGEEVDDKEIQLKEKNSTKKSKKNVCKGDVSDESNDHEGESSSLRDGSFKLADRLAEKQAKKLAKAEKEAKLLSQIPTRDPETGIPYSKMQLRRMKRRVKHGLNPIPTEEEEREIKVREERERRQEERLFYFGADDAGERRLLKGEDVNNGDEGVEHSDEEGEEKNKSNYGNDNDVEMERKN